MREAPMKWQEYQTFAARLQGVHKSTTVVSKGGEKIRNEAFHLELKQSGPWTFSKTLEYGPDLPYHAIAKVVNSRYGFITIKPKEGAAWRLSEIDLNLADAEPIDPRERKENVLRAVCVLLGVERLSLPQVVTTKDFVVKQVAQVPEREAPEAALIQMDCAWHRPKGDQSEAPNMEGSLQLDPKHHFVIRQGSLDVVYVSGSRAKYTFQNDYAINRDGFAVPIRQKRRTTFDNGMDAEEIRSLDFFEAESVPEIEFTLTALGLPEPVGITFDQPTRWYLWFGVASAAFLIAGALIARYRKRGAPSNAS